MRLSDNPNVTLEDQTLRDGLQNVPRIIPTSEKARLFDLLVEAGIKRIQVGSFVSPKAAPQMSDTEELIAMIRPPADVALTALALNRRGLERALACGLKHVSLSVSVSDTHSRKNVNRPAGQALREVCGLIEEARRAGVSVRGGVQCAFGCQYEGPVKPKRVIETAQALAGAGADEINLADTAGMATPRKTLELTRMARTNLPLVNVSLHLHDGAGQAMRNLLAGYEGGARLFDVCVGGMGGCPANRWTGANVSTEEAVVGLGLLGAQTGVDHKKLRRAADLIKWLAPTELYGRDDLLAGHTAYSSEAYRQW